MEDVSSGQGGGGPRAANSAARKAYETDVAMLQGFHKSDENEEEIKGTARLCDKEQKKLSRDIRDYDFKALKRLLFKKKRYKKKDEKNR